MKKGLFILVFFTFITVTLKAQNCPPIAVCYTGITVQLEPNGDFLMWPQDIYADSIPDSCQSVLSMELEITDLAQNVIHPKADSVLLTCDDVEQSLIAVLHITDGQTTNTCWGTLTVGDQHGYCEDFGPDSIPVIFANQFGARIPLDQLTAELNGNPIGEYRDGLFIMRREDILPGTNTLAINADNSGHFGWVTTLDVVFAMRMFFDLSYTPLRAQVMDVDLSSSMSVGDPIRMQEFILGIRSDLSDRNMLPLPNDYRFGAGFDRYDFGIDPYTIEFRGDTVDQVNFIYTVYYRGDIDNIDSLAGGGLQTRSTGEARINYMDQMLSSGQPVEVTFTAQMSDGMSIHGFQCELDASAFAGIRLLDQSTGNTIMSHEQNGKFRLSFAQADPEEKVTFRLLLTPKQSGMLSTALRLTDGFTQELVPADLQAHQLEMKAERAAVGALTAFPNPFSDVLEIGIPATVSGSVQLLTIDGRVLQEQVINEGTTVVRMNATGIAPGVYLVRLLSSGSSDLIKVIRQ